MTSTVAGSTPGTPPRRIPSPAVLHLEILGALLDRHPSGHLAHRDQEREGPVGLPDGFIGDRDGLGLDHRPRQSLVRREVEIGEDDLTRADQRVFRRLRLLDVHDHVGALVYLRRGPGDLGAVGAVGLVVESAADSGAFLDENRVAVALQDLDAGRGHGYPVFLWFDLLENADDHLLTPLLSGLNPSRTSRPRSPLRASPCRRGARPRSSRCGRRWPWRPCPDRSRSPWPSVCRRRF